MTRAPEFTVAFGRPADPAAADGRLDAAAFHRNHEAIGTALAADLATMQGDVLEIGSGTGQHAVAFAQQAPHLVWWPSDPNADRDADSEARRPRTHASSNCFRNSDDNTLMAGFLCGRPVSQPACSGGC